MNAAVNVSRIEPTDWYVGMKQAITPEVKAQCEALGKAMAEKLLAE